jgi:NAD(P)-dependent dehydrogenase (short-subunit alcohol dehydrogenase family)
LLKEKVAKIIAASSILGLGISIELLAGGAAVIMCSRKIASTQEPASLIKCDAHYQRLYVTDANTVPESARHGVERHKRGSNLVNNVGYNFDHKIRNKTFHKAVEGDFVKIIDVDLKGISMVLHGAIVASIASEEFTSITDNAIAIQSGTVLP